MNLFVLGGLRGGDERQAQGGQGMGATEGQRALTGDVLDGGALARGGEGVAEDPWARCAATFLEAKEKKTGSAQTRDHYERTLRAFAAACPTHPARVTPGEVQVFAQAPARRRGRGDIVVENPARPATVARRVAVLSSFYRFAMKQVVAHDAHGRPVPLCTYNPAAAVDRPRVDPYRSVRGLGQKQTKLLLAAIPRDTPLGLRDHALLSMYLYTGRRREEIIALRWRDIERGDDGRTFFRYRGKGNKMGFRELPRPAADALRTYIGATGRTQTIKPDDPLWLPHGEGARKRADGALTSNAVYRRLKHYAALVDIDPQTLSLHGLRHTGAKLRQQVGASMEEVQRFLDHTSVATTQIYLRATDAVDDPLADKVAALLEKEE